MGGASSDLQSDIGSSINQDKRDSVSTSSSDSIDKLAFVTGFYQHRSYKRGDDDKEENGSGETDIEGNTMSDYNHQSYSDLTDMDGYEERPRLYLANPDNDSDSD
ncbi:uncharacterized protein SPAPADRAFT_59661 [Spathaspora passalidarum NRRL Y-27907]|uniref:Uncharacterized protein n=1 Tax=Spathaspora passalidarum (strain NRRL Y-27907 / 11-Y1) TaxID=619300 RepID=G3AHR6_SPAPN|nr:uncharacterized protein SPAPADRAFT_59661 [Spathaspora passalidarum NRRL Y-27907]EGW34230.1 hypothetical protein SPAPADRAFT_59661 [Spathaspora passalidarum NRRL Y-27907]